MQQQYLEKLKYPIGKFIRPQNYVSELITDYIRDIETFPSELKKEVGHLSDEQLDTVYRPGGWTIRQVVHHCADSHMNALTRFKLALTEEKPTIKPYREPLFAELPDAKHMSIAPSLMLLEGLHTRWATLLRSVTRKDLDKTFFHPEYKKEYTLNEAAGMYAWHCRHHLAQVTTLKDSNGWK